MKITYDTYLDKVYGGWIGKCLGGAAGAPVEGYKHVIEIKDYKEVMRPDLPNDDLDLQLLWLEVLQKKGLGLTVEDLAHAWAKQCWYPFNEYGIFLKNYELGIMPPYSGSFDNPVFCEGEGSPIRSEIWGMIFPGMPKEAAKYAKQDSILDHSGESVWIEMFYAAVEADAFFESDIKKLILNNLDYLPEKSRARACVLDVINYVAVNPDWLIVRKKLMRQYAHFDFTNAITNLGIVILALLCGEGLDDAINITFRSGFDTDSTGATVGAIYGIILGASQIDDELKKLVGNDLAIGIDVVREDASIEKLAVDVCQIGLEATINEKTEITKVPDDVNIIIRKKSKLGICLHVNYDSQPSIGVQQPCPFSLTIKNNTKQKISEVLRFKNLPSSWLIDYNDIKVTLEPKSELVLKNCISLKNNCKNLKMKNLVEIEFGDISASFGIAGAGIWQTVGPYFEPLVKEDDPSLPLAHSADCVLPTLECMVNNAAYLEHSYITEKNFKETFSSEESEILTAPEKFLPLDQNFTFKGQGCIYLRQEIILPKESDAWIVIGNNDGFKLWINETLEFNVDENRLWTPYNNYKIVKLNEGKNEVVLKLLRRTESLKFSLGWRKYEGEHFHKKRWMTDMSYEIN